MSMTSFDLPGALSVRSLRRDILNASGDAGNVEKTDFFLARLQRERQKQQ